MVSVGLLLVSLLFLAAGGIQLLWPETLAINKQRWDAIQNPHKEPEQDPQDWIVTYTRRGGVLLFGIGLLLLGIAVGAL